MSRFARDISTGKTYIWKLGNGGLNSEVGVVTNINDVIQKLKADFAGVLTFLNKKHLLTQGVEHLVFVVGLKASHN